jgi:protocadherin-16/23
LDREAKAIFELIAEARDLGSPPRSSRVPVKVQVTDVNDNAPLIVEPEEDVIGVREQQPVGTEVVRVRAIDRDEGENSSITYSIVQSEYIVHQFTCMWAHFVYFSLPKNQPVYEYRK